MRKSIITGLIVFVLGGTAALLGVLPGMSGLLPYVQTQLEAAKAQFVSPTVAVRPTLAQ